MIVWLSLVTPKTQRVNKENMIEAPREIPVPPASPVVKVTSESFNPIIITGIAIIKPARGPAIPISSRTFLSGKGDLILMKAPKVPNMLRGGGAGIKYGSVAFTPLLWETIK